MMTKAAVPDKRRRRRDRGSISVDEILSGAFEVAAEVSVENLSMPLLAKHLDVGVTSIYWYFRKKDDLLAAMTDRALDSYEFCEPIDADNWRESLRNHAWKMRQTFLADPILCDLLLIRGRRGDKGSNDVVWKVEQPRAALVDAGLSAEQAADAYAAICVHSRGSAVLERLRQRIPGVEFRRGGQVKIVDEQATPLIAGAVHDGRLIGVANDANFGFVLECILEHAATLIAEAKSQMPA
jgi:AcrR family transcriptional regulator